MNDLNLPNESGNFKDGTRDYLNNCFAPGFDSVQMSADLHSLVNGKNGGHLEQSYLYLDPESARDWCNIANQDAYIAGQEGFPYQKVISGIKRCLSETFGEGKKSLEVIALGPGDGKKEVRLVQRLAESIPNLSIHLTLLDISQPLLARSYKYAASILKSIDGVFVSGMQADMNQLYKYDELLYLPADVKRPRLITMLGYTFGNLDHERLFIRNNLQSGFKGGDMLLLDVALKFSPSNDPEVISRLDARLSGKIPVGWERAYNQFLKGPLKRYSQEEIRNIKFSYLLDPGSCVITDSYGVEVKIKATMATGEEKDFAMFRIKRYEADSLILAVKEEKWAPFDGWIYGLRKDAFLYLWRKED